MSKLLIKKDGISKRASKKQYDTIYAKRGYEIVDEAKLAEAEKATAKKGK